jgi:hypothetical protein
MLKLFPYILAMVIVSALTVYQPARTAEPGANPLDPAKEDLTRVEYPSHKTIKWRGRFIGPNETLESLFGDNWKLVARFNRIDRRHVYPGMTIKVPENIDDIRKYSPLPAEYEPAKRHEKYILVSMT